MGQPGWFRTPKNNTNKPGHKWIIEGFNLKSIYRK